MRISTFAERTGLPVETLRYYQKIGLLTPATERGQRRYSEADRLRVEAIGQLKRMGFSLDEIRRLLELDDLIESGLRHGVHRADLAREGLELLREKEAALRLREEEIRQVRQHLARLMEKLERFLRGEEP